MRPQAYLLLILFILLAASCRQRYWYRSVVWSHSKPYLPITIKVVNESPFFVSHRFEQEIQKACEKQLARRGYYVNAKSSKYQFVLNIKVDSFFVKGLAYIGGYRSSTYEYSGKVLSIMFECAMYDPKRKWNIWKKENELYFFNQENRDLRRSKSLVRYLIRSAT